MMRPTGVQPASATEVAAHAARRAARFRVLGRLLVAEPEPDDVALAEALPMLARHCAGSSELRADYHRALLSGVAAYESAFTSPDGQLGAVNPGLAGIYRRFDVDWQAYRVAAPDHLGVQLLAYAHLCELEAEAWADDRPDRASQVVETERELLARHFGSWAPAANEAIARAGAGTAYAALAELCDEVLTAEYEYLRPAAQHPGMPPVEHVGAVDPLAGSGAIARRLLAPARAGGYLLAGDVAPLAAAVQVPWRPSDTRSRLRHVIDAALARGCLERVTEVVTPLVEGWRARWEAARAATPGAARTYETWRLRADGTVRWLQRLDAAGAAGPATRVVGSHERLAAVLATLSAAGFAVTTEPAPADVRASVDVLVRLEEGATERWDGDPPPGASARLA